jgi:DNA-binding response OmpR family regulator
MATLRRLSRPTHLGQAPSLGNGQRCGVLPDTRATILVLEESPAVQELIDQALRELGHRVLSTKDALEALDVVRRVRVDVLVVGVLLDAEKQSLVRELRSIQSEVRIVSICGPEDDAEEIDDGASLFTPFSLDDLRAAVAPGLPRRLWNDADGG